MAVAEGIPQGVRKLYALQADLFRIEPLDKEIGCLLLARRGRYGQREAKRELRMAARRRRVADLAGDLRLRHPGERLLIRAVASGPAAIGRPGDGHRRVALQESREILDEAPGLDAGRHPLVLLEPIGEHLDAGLAVDRRAHGVGVEK